MAPHRAKSSTASYSGPRNFPAFDGSDPTTVYLKYTTVTNFSQSQTYSATPQLNTSCVGSTTRLETVNKWDGNITVTQSGGGTDNLGRDCGPSPSIYTADPTVTTSKTTRTSVTHVYHSQTTGDNTAVYMYDVTVTETLENPYTADQVYSDLLALLKDLPEWGQSVASSYKPDGTINVVTTTDPNGFAAQIGQNYTSEGTTGGDITISAVEYIVTFPGPICENDGPFQIRAQRIHQSLSLDYVGADDLTSTVSPSVGDTSYTIVFSLPLPDPGVETFIAGSNAAPEVFLNLQSKGGIFVKKGFLEYKTKPGATPKVYRTETFSGSFPGIAGLSLTAKSYSGAQRRISANIEPEGTTEVDDPGGASETDVSSDIPAEYQSAFYAGVYAGTGPLTIPQPDTRTFASDYRAWTKTIRFNGNDYVDRCAAALNDEYTTGELQSLAAQVKALGFGHFGGDSVVGNIGGVAGWSFGVGEGVYAANFLTSDETLIADIESQYTVQARINVADTTGLSATFQLRTLTIDLASNTTTYSTTGVTINFDPSAPNQGVSDPIDLIASPGQIVVHWLHPADNVDPVTGGVAFTLNPTFEVQGTAYVVPFPPSTL